MTLSIIIEFCYAVSLMLTVVYAECRKLALYAECQNAECHYGEWRYAECLGARGLAIDSAVS
jgi:hypothetical protein